MSLNVEAQDYIDAMAEARGYVLPYHATMAEADFDTLRRANELISQVYLQQRSLDRKTKELIFISTLTVLRAPVGQIRSHIRVALECGATKQDVLEAIEITLPEAGVVVFQHGFNAWCEEVGVVGIQPRLNGDGAEQDGGTSRAHVVSGSRNDR